MTAESTRTHLRRQIARLERVRDFGMLHDAASAMRLLRTMRAYLNDTVTAPLGAGEIARLVGPNGGPCSEPAIDDVCRGVEGRGFTTLVGGFVVDAA